MYTYVILVQAQDGGRQVCICCFPFVYVCVYLHLRVFVCMYVHYDPQDGAARPAFTCSYVCLCLFVCVCVCKHIHFRLLATQIDMLATDYSPQSHPCHVNMCKIIIYASNFSPHIDKLTIDYSLSKNLSMCISERSSYTLLTPAHTARHVDHRLLSLKEPIHVCTCEDITSYRHQDANMIQPCN